LNGTVIYYFGVTGGNGYLVNGTNIIELVGQTSFALGDISA
jgi:hypothetical protein